MFHVVASRKIPWKINWSVESPPPSKTWGVVKLTQSKISFRLPTIDNNFPAPLIRLWVSITCLILPINSKKDHFGNCGFHNAGFSFFLLFTCHFLFQHTTRGFCYWISYEYPRGLKFRFRSLLKKIVTSFHKVYITYTFTSRSFKCLSMVEVDVRLRLDCSPWAPRDNSKRPASHVPSVEEILRTDFWWQRSSYQSSKDKGECSMPSTGLIDPS